MGNGRISRDMLREKTKNISTQDYSQIVQDNYLESQKQTDMIETQFNMIRMDTMSADLLGMNESQPNNF
jgi:formylmethanofuran dehydrogenase subunit D